MLSAPTLAPLSLGLPRGRRCLWPWPGSARPEVRCDGVDFTRELGLAVNGDPRTNRPPYSSLDRLRNGPRDHPGYRLVLSEAGMSHFQVSQFDGPLDHNFTALEAPLHKSVQQLRDG